MGSPWPGPVGWRPRVAVVAVLVAVISPALRNHDSFPLSTYPMYARPRSGVETLPAVLAIDSGGTARRLTSATVAQTDDPLIATSLLRTAIRSGRAGALCTTVASRAPAGTVTVQVVEDRVDLVASARGRDRVLERVVHARCAVPR